MSVHFMSQSVEWATPKGVYDELDGEFHFNDDPCPLYGVESADGLAREWGNSTFVNPPYGRTISLWTSKAVREWRRGNIVVMLIPSRTDTIWWHRDIMQADEIRFIKGRLKFGNATNSAPFPSAVVVFRQNPCLHYGAGTLHYGDGPRPIGITYTMQTCPDCGESLSLPAQSPRGEE